MLPLSTIYVDWPKICLSRPYLTIKCLSGTAPGVNTADLIHRNKPADSFMMSGLYKYFGGGGAKKDSARDTIIDMRAHLETLRKREAALEADRDRAEAEARKMVSINKDKARDALKRKARHQANLEKLWGQMSSIEQQLTAIESANLNLETMKVMERGASAMKTIHKGIDIDKVDQTMDEIRDQVQLGEEVSDAISRPLHETDEVELDEELELLEQEALDDKMLNVGTMPEVPATSRTSAAPAEKEEEDEDAILEQLMAEMAA